MSVFYQIVVAYDIEDSKQRTKIFEKLKDFGLVSIQKSIMWGYINYAEEKAIQTELNTTLQQHDKGIILRVTNADKQIQERGIGYKNFSFDNLEDSCVL